MGMRPFLWWLVGPVLIVILAFRPWVRSGQRWRSSYEILESADNLGFLDGFVQRVGLVGWFLVPAAVALLAVLIAMRRLAAAALVAILVGVLGAVIGGAVWVSGLPSSWAPKATAIIGLVTIVAGPLPLLVRNPRLLASGR